MAPKMQAAVVDRFGAPRVLQEMDSFVGQVVTIVQEGDRVGVPYSAFDWLGETRRPT